MKVLANDGIDSKGKAAVESLGITVLTDKVPQDELDKLRWPPEKITFNSKTDDVCVLPKWVGDTTNYLQKSIRITRNPTCLPVQNDTCHQPAFAHMAWF